jgi:endonuclease YncB( thermonuclease family)
LWRGGPLALAILIGPPLVGAFFAVSDWLFPTIVEGQARVIDGDTVDVAGRRIRLQGIDAPELRQTCVRGGHSFSCGRDVRAQLIAFLAERPVRCRVVDIDVYRRAVARCSVGADDIGFWIVSTGLALATEGGAYASAQQDAQRERRGLWSGEWQEPRRFREEHAR